MKRILAVWSVLLMFMVSGCATAPTNPDGTPAASFGPSFQMDALCRGVTGSLNTLTPFKASLKLAQKDSVDIAIKATYPICYSETVPTSSEALASVNSMLSEMVALDAARQGKRITPADVLAWSYVLSNMIIVGQKINDLYQQSLQNAALPVSTWATDRIAFKDAVDAWNAAPGPVN